MKYTTIGDVHGSDKWKNAVYQFNDNQDIMSCNLDNSTDKIVFIGDYVDDWYLSNATILHNLKEIIQLKKDYPDNVILLWGNHDDAYLVGNGKISGFRYEMMHDLYDIFNRNKDLFQLAYQHGNVIWTHAGIHRGWWQYYVQPIISGVMKTRFSDFLGDCENVADYLNLMWEFNYPNLFMISHHRGGSGKVGGPLWADKIEIYTKPLYGYHQIVGHSPVSEIKTYVISENTKVTFVDCLNVCDDFYTIELQ